MRIHILGGCGCGKTTMAKKLAQDFGLSHYDLDELNWDNTAAQHNTKADPLRRDARLTSISSTDNWVIEGVYYKWCTPSFRAADCIILLETPRWIRQLRVLRRFSRKLLTNPHSLRQSEIKNLWSLLCWNHFYDKNNLAKAKTLIAALGRHPVICHSEAEVRTAMASATTPSAS